MHFPGHACWLLLSLQVGAGQGASALMGALPVPLLSPGDAVLVLWRVQHSQLRDTISLVLQCSQQIQDKYGIRETDVGLKLQLKIGMGSAGLVALCVDARPRAVPQRALQHQGEVVIPAGASGSLFCGRLLRVLEQAVACMQTEQVASKAAGLLGLWWRQPQEVPCTVSTLSAPALFASS